MSLDTFTWQMLASVFWPGSFIRCVVNATSTALALGHIDGDIAKAQPTVVCLAAIPFIVKPIDGTIDTAMEMSVSKALNGKIEGPPTPASRSASSARASSCPHPVLGRRRDQGRRRVKDYVTTFVGARQRALGERAPGRGVGRT